MEWNGSPFRWISESGCVRYRMDEVNTNKMETELAKATNITCTVLVGKQTQYGVNFVAWDWSYDRTGVNHGHYHMENYRGAKEDFTVRSGLLLKERLFTQEHLVERYRAVHGFLHEEQIEGIETSLTAAAACGCDWSAA